ncbi:MAG TPA: hypothetical protein VJ990_06780 [Clostridia bacterium]|nr:hypothetical protein [Clostridia bacterium]
MSKKSGWMHEAFDILFIMILCFATLLSAMLIKGSNPLKMEYVLKPVTFILTFGAVMVYIWYVARESEKGLKAMVEKVYGQE